MPILWVDPWDREQCRRLRAVPSSSDQCRPCRLEVVVLPVAPCGGFRVVQSSQPVSPDHRPQRRLPFYPVPSLPRPLQQAPRALGVRGGAVTVEEKRGGVSRRDRRWRRLTELQIAWDSVLVLLVFVDIVTLPLSVCGFVASLGPEWLVFWATTEALFAIDLLKRLLPLRPETADLDVSPWRRSVDWSYLKSAQCALDVLSLLPADFAALAVV